MSLTLIPAGTLTVHYDQSWSFGNGPIGGRSCTNFHSIAWQAPNFHARSVWANGSYIHGPEIAAPNIRAMFEIDDDTLIYLDYQARIHTPTHHLPVGTSGKTPAMMVGHIETDVSGPNAWLHRTHLVGEGVLDPEAATQTYELFVLASDALEVPWPAGE